MTRGKVPERSSKGSPMFKSAVVGFVVAVISCFIAWGVASVNPFQTGEFWTDLIALAATAVVASGIATGVTIMIADSTGDTVWIWPVHIAIVIVGAIVGGFALNEMLNDPARVYHLYDALVWGCYAFGLTFYVFAALASYIVVED